MLYAALTLPLFLLAFYYPPNLHTSAASQPRAKFCQSPTIAKRICTINAQTRKPQCHWQCIPAPSPTLRPIPTTLKCPLPPDCPLECIIVTDLRGCDTCRCDL
jgi:hypothetical protein